VLKEHKPRNLKLSDAHKVAREKYPSSLTRHTNLVQHRVTRGICGLGCEAGAGAEGGIGGHVQLHEWDEWVYALKADRTRLVGPEICGRATYDGGDPSKGCFSAKELQSGVYEVGGARVVVR
jgi:hypothetical protein